MRLSLKIFISILLLIPTVTMFTLAYSNYNGTDITLYLSYFSDTVIYVLFSTVLSVVIGTLSAFFISLYQFPYRDIYQKLYILPLVFPSYMMALVYGEIDSSFMNIWGLIFVTTLVSFPYVYIVMYSHISSISNEYSRTADVFGISTYKKFKDIIFPLMLPGIIVSSIIVMSDTLSEFGASFFYGVDTIMVVVYEHWFGIYDMGTATMISSITLFVVFIIFYVKLSMKGKILINPITAQPNKLIKLNKSKGILVSLILSIPVIFSLIIPIGVLNEWFILSYRKVDFSDVWITTFNTLGFSVVIVFLTAVLSLGVLYLFKDSRLIRTLLSLNYAIPGLFLSIILLQLFSSLSVTVSFFMLILAYVLKYNMLMLNSVEGYTSRIDRRLYYSTKSVGKSSLWFINNIQVPLAKKGILLGSVLVFIDVIRELPIMLTLRPFGFETISTKIFYYYDSEWIYYTAPYFGVMLVATLIPVLFLVRHINDRS